MTPSELKQKAEAWRREDPDPHTAAELQALLTRASPEDLASLADRFAGSLEFGTAGLRGVVGAGPEPDEPRGGAPHDRGARALPARRSVPDAAERGVVDGRDGRRMSAEFAEDTACVLAAAGIPALVFPDVGAHAAARLRRAGARARGRRDGDREPQPARVQRLQGLLGQRRADRPAARRGHRRGPSTRCGPRTRCALLDPDGGARARPRGASWRLAGVERYLDAIDGARVHRGTGIAHADLVYTPLHGVGRRLAWSARCAARASRTCTSVPEQAGARRRASPPCASPTPRSQGRWTCASRSPSGVRRGPGARQRPGRGSARRHGARRGRSRLRAAHRQRGGRAARATTCSRRAPKRAAALRGDHHRLQHAAG